MVSKLDFIAPLFVPAHRHERFLKAAASGADAIILDLEDAVFPEDKEEARRNLNAGLTDLPVVVRINAAGTRWFGADLSAVTANGFAAIMLPKAEAASVTELAAAGHRNIIALVESARGIADARQIAASPAVLRLAFGSIDYCADIGAAHTRDALLSARSELVLASRLAGLIAPLDGVTASISDDALTESDTRYARYLGFGGKLCIHPRQIAPVMTGFFPDAAEIAWAEKILASGNGAVAVDGAMVDEPVRIRARSLLGRVRSLKSP